MKCNRYFYASGSRVNNIWFWKKVKWKYCDHCNMHHSNRKIPNTYLNDDWKMYDFTKIKVGVILVKENKLWMIESYNKCFGFPKGEKENNETEIECARREFYEETGTRITITENNRKIIKTFDNVTYIFYVVNVNKDFEIFTFPKDDIEITSFGWVDIRNAKKLNLSHISKKVLYLYIKYFKFR